MALPRLLASHLGPTIPLQPSLARATAKLARAGQRGGGPPPPGPASNWNLNFNMQLQLQTNWCWAATSSSVHRFYKPAAKNWTQCRVANAELTLKSCCKNGSSTSCNVPWFLDRALTRVGHFQSMSTGAFTVAQLQVELQASHPVGCRVGWSGGGGHFVVIDGLSISGSTRVTVRDPIYGTSSMDYNTFCTAYQTTGSWTHAYNTTP
jgi:hypothetical protein